MDMTNDQYKGLAKLEKWYRKYNHQFIDISGTIGTGTWDLIQKFIEDEEFERDEVMYLSYDQKQVLEMASKRYHTYYINGIIYKYIKIIDFDTLPVLNPRSPKIEYEWKKEVRKKIDPRYKLMVVFDSILMDEQTLNDLASFGLPIILLRDPELMPVGDTYTYLRDPNIVLREVHPEYERNPIVHFAHKILHDDKLKLGNYDNLSIIPRKQMNLFNLKSADMVITISDQLSRQVNLLYRDKILKQKSIINVPGERVIVMSNMYGHRLVNSDEKNIKIYLTKGLVGYINRCYKHAVNTKYLPMEFRPEFYHGVFEELVMDRHYLNKIDVQSRQIIPDEVVYFDYAYSLSAMMARLSHWDKVTLIADPNELGDYELQKRLMYSAVTRATRSLTMLI